MMKVAVYFSPWGKAISPTGVSRHAVEMTAGLGSRSDIQTTRFSTRAEHERFTNKLPERVAKVPVSLLPGREAFARRLFMTQNWWGVDRWAENPDWVYCTKEQPVTTRRAKLAVTVHDVLALEANGLYNSQKVSFYRRWLLGYIMRRLCRADLITTVSEFTKNRLVELVGVDPARVVVTGNGVSDTYFRGPQPQDVELLSQYGVEPQKYFVSVGGLTWRKGGDLLLGLGSILQQQGCNHPILVTGRRHDDDLVARLKECQADHRDFPVRLLGYVSDDHQCILLSNAVALVFPTRYEGFGIPAIEAMAAETVAVCSSTTSIPEVVGDAGILVDPLTEENLAQALLTLVHRPSSRRPLIERGKIHAEQYRWSNCVNRLIVAMQARA